jgi:hypothetical protein
LPWAIGSDDHTNPAQDQDAPNVAVKYLRADASLRQSYPLPTDAAANLQKALESPLNEEGEKLVGAADEALIEFQHGASSKQKPDKWLRFVKTA